VILLDSFAVLAYLKGEPAAAEVRRLLISEDCALLATGTAEVVDHLVRTRGAAAEHVMLDLMSIGLVEALPVDSVIGAAAGAMRATHYHRTTCSVSLADCVAAAAAKRHQASLATADPHLLDVCRAEGIATVALPGSG